MFRKTVNGDITDEDFKKFLFRLMIIMMNF